MKIVINACFGGFSLSHKAIMRYAELKGINLITTPNQYFGSDFNYYINNTDDDNFWSSRHIPRNDEHLIQVITELGQEASGNCAKLKIVEIPDDVKWIIKEYDGNEHVAEQHRTWS